MKRSILGFILWAGTAWVAAAATPAASDLPPDWPRGLGLAARYPLDRGLEADPAVLFVETFDHASTAALAARWENLAGPECLSLIDDGPPGGGRALLVRHVGGRGTGAHLYRRLAPGFDRLYVRFYVRFDPDGAPIHHFVHVGGYEPPTPWPQGGAGERPRGDERITVGIEPMGREWRWDYYAYWWQMRGSPPAGRTWGNTFLGAHRPAAERGRWTCVEMMIRLNDPARADGELALWIDGEPVSRMAPGTPRGKWVYDRFLPGEGGESIRWDEARGGPVRFQTAAGGEPFEGFRWRTDARLRLNFLWLLVYITQAPPGHESRVAFDQVVAAREYIGPMTTPAPRRAATVDAPARGR